MKNFTAAAALFCAAIVLASIFHRFWPVRLVDRLPQYRQLQAGETPYGPSSEEHARDAVADALTKRLLAKLPSNSPILKAEPEELIAAANLHLGLSIDASDRAVIKRVRIATSEWTGIGGSEAQGRLHQRAAGPILDQLVAEGRCSSSGAPPSETPEQNRSRKEFGMIESGRWRGKDGVDRGFRLTEKEFPDYFALCRLGRREAKKFGYLQAAIKAMLMVELESAKPDAPR